MTATYTPGEWEAIPPARTGKHWKVGAKGSLGGKGTIANASMLWIVALIHNGAPGDTLETEEANARLIAAAPELLAALEKLVVDWSSVNERVQVPDEINEDSHWEAARAAIAKARGD